MTKQVYKGWAINIGNEKYMSDFWNPFAPNIEQAPALFAKAETAKSCICIRKTKFPKAKAEYVTVTVQRARK